MILAGSESSPGWAIVWTVVAIVLAAVLTLILKDY